LTGLTMRTAVTSGGAALDDIETGLHSSSAVSGLLTTLPVICFAGLGAAAPQLSIRLGRHRLLVAALLVSAVGTVLRALVGSTWLFLVLSVLALTGGAVANVLLPALVKEHFPDRIGAMTAVYTTALAVGISVAAGLTVPLGDLAGGASGWRFGIGVWALFAVVAVVPWLPTVAREIRPTAASQPSLVRELARSRIAWALTGFFGTQSMAAYIGFGWVARFMHAHGVSETAAGWMVALLSSIGIPISMVVPIVPPARHRLVVLVLGACWAASYAGLGAAPVSGAWVWMVLYGIGGGMFPLSLTMIGLRSADPATVAALSAFVQSIGYVIAGLGPLLFGVFYGATGSWALPLGLLWVSLAFSIVTGWVAAAPRLIAVR
jgi:CP family cyanate transporter-like MFS transporter